MFWVIQTRLPSVPHPGYYLENGCARMIWETGTFRLIPTQRIIALSVNRTATQVSAPPPPTAPPGYLRPEARTVLGCEPSEEGTQSLSAQDKTPVMSFCLSVWLRG